MGEVCIRGPNVTAGYLDNPKANEEAFAGAAPRGVTAEVQTPSLRHSSRRLRNAGHMHLNAHHASASPQ